ncbi:anti-phage dCTP deaminase [Ramlibacter albus]|uniref:Deoxycytidylate deaminase n=1 Tax=Ramlibacter albus TaxID=2079448 RepID=A0A923S435_9BURK|nr:anti-phage dCTP deaminase [Ramlibacter albus]MBC5763702.1 deoxycytidylate deaminase [Ramlibacter albus]
MSAVLHAVPGGSSSKKSNDALLEKFDSRQSGELIIGLAGPMGCGIGTIVDGLRDRLRERGYTDVVHIKLSKFLEDSLANKLVSEWGDADASRRFVRYRRLQEAGKELRRKSKNPAILAEYAAQEIAVDRRRRQRQSSQTGQAIPAPNSPLVPGRIAYLIDQVKRPEEVRLLRAIYRNLFYLLGVTRINDHRKDQLETEQVRSDETQRLIDIDRLEAGDGGQQLDKTLHLADYFIRNDATTVDEKRLKLNRFLDLVHGDKSTTPTDAEHGMYAAYAASLRSACLSRQVGASISSATGEVLATGCNDVPKATGGLYSASFKGHDKRCVHMDGQQCFNDLYKRKLQTEIGELVDKALEKAGKGTWSLPQDDRAELLTRIYDNTRLKDLIEFSRSVHAEMDAIVSLARLGGAGLHGATLYTTTYPCHNCARHIVAAGIMKVFYIEPYEKSLAKDLHKDAIAFEVEETKEGEPSRVEFLHYEGVAPRQFHSVFRAASRKDSDGKYIPIRPMEADKVLPEYLDNYQDFETKAVEHLNEEIERLRPAAN